MTIKVYIISRPQFGEAYKAFLVDFLPEGDGVWRETENATPAERLVEFAGRACYMSFGSRQSPGTNAEYIRKLIRNEHDSVLEHAAWTVLLSGVSRAFTHQLVRHRIGFSYSQLSQQYHDQSHTLFVRPLGLSEFPNLAEIWDRSVNESQSAYRQILEGLSEQSNLTQDRREAVRAIRSAARSVLPNATETAIVVTFNARSLRHFLSVRGNVVGDAEMRCASAALLEAIRPEGPALFFDFSIEYLGDGLPVVMRDPHG
jgi:thymidylate synthase (FAD)